MKLCLTCEHAGHEVEDWLGDGLKIPNEVLLSHRGWDPGAFKIATRLKKRLMAPLWSVHSTRLLIEPNRSIGHPKLFSQYSKNLAPHLKAKALNLIYYPFRRQICHWIETQESEESIMHLSIHSFTPILNDVHRKADVGLLYDPASKLETQICHQLGLFLKDRGWDVRKNYPYQGASDGHTTALRRQYGKRYAGIEIEINQKFFEKTERLSQKMRTLSDDLAEATLEILKSRA